LDVLITNPSRLAAAAPVRTTAATGNSGTASVGSVEVIDPTNAQLRSSVTIEFLSPTTYSINGAGTYTLNSDNSIEYNGWRLEISGTPTAGDEFTVADNTTGAGDNRNALKLAEALGNPVLDGGTASLSASANRLVGDIGITTRQSQASRDAQQVVQQDSFAARDAVSGVNLDEEAANMLRYQQAYQAAAQIIRVASTLFDSLLAAAQR
jgi:flagellar hook-associated protein 1